MSDTESRYRLQLFGAFQLLAPDGTEIEVRSRKSRALLGILACSPNGERSRIWLQELLWSRGSSGASLRKELSRLHKLTAPYEVEIFVDSVPRDIVRLDLDVIDSDVMEESDAVRGEFLEGLTISYEEKFDDWLHSQRAVFNSPNVLGITNRFRNKQNVKQLKVVTDTEVVPTMFCIGINPVVWEGGYSSGPQVPIVNDIITRIGKLLQSTGLIELYDRRYNIQSTNLLTASVAEKCDAELMVKAYVQSAYRNITISLLDKRSGRVIFLRREQFRHLGDPDDSADFNNTKWFIAEVADEIIDRISSDQKISNEQRGILNLLHSSVDDMFGLTSSGLASAERKLDLALEHCNTSAANAWRSYLCTLKFDSEDSEDPALIREQARHYAAKSLEHDRYNVLSLSLLTHVNAFVLQNLDSARDIMNRVRMIGSDHVMSYDADSLLNLYSGNFDKARHSALRAAYLGQYLPFRYVFMTTLCMINGLEGNYDQAVRAGEKSLSQQPVDAERPYPPTIRYLSQSYAKLGQHEKSEELIHVLQQADAGKQLDSEDDGSKVSPSELIRRFLDIGSDSLAD